MLRSSAVQYPSASRSSLTGAGVLEWMLVSLAGEYKMKLMPGPLTCLISILLTFDVSLLVWLMAAGKKGKQICSRH